MSKQTASLATDTSNPLLKTCTNCAETKPLTDFHAQAGRIDGHKSQCKACLNAGLRKGGPRPLPKQQSAILLALRSNGLRFEQIKARAGAHMSSALKTLVNQGHVMQDADGFYELTTSGKAIAPSRNPAYAKRFQPVQAQGKGA